MRRWWYIALSALMLAPVYWQSRLQAGDLSSHIYNAWLAQLIESGRAQGLVIASQSTNILFDLMLSGLFRLFGAGPAQRVSVSVAVLVFVWGAYRFVSVVGGRPALHLLPCIAMLSYGWVFHMGFFNFYLSMGLCFWALATAWEWSPRRMAITVALLPVAWLAHALPVLWAVGLLAYQALARRLPPRARAYLTAACLLGLVLIQVVVGRTTLSKWSPQQIRMATGADQLWVFDGKYCILLAGLIVVWGSLFLDLLRKPGPRWVVSSIPFQFCVISAAAVMILPGTILLPGYRHNLVYIAERMSLGVGICFCALLAAARPGRFSRYGMGLVALVFFGFLYRDEKILNAIEDRMDGAISQLRPGQRVVSGVDDPFLRVAAVTHMIDRACLGRCFSYANYEPSTWQFRIRAIAENPYVASGYADSWDMQTGSYVVRDRDLPLLQLSVDRGGRMAVRSLEAGKPCGRTSLTALPFLFPLN